jgi:hypothetical protein
MANPATEADCTSPAFMWKLWLYTNYDCNLRCSYCVAKSGPNVPRRALGLANVQRLVDEAVTLGFSDVFFTGGEPFILKDIYDMLAYSSVRIKTTVLTNAMLLQNKRLDKLCEVANDNLIVQVSLDGGCPEDHVLTGAKAVGPKQSKVSSCCRSAGSASVSAPPKPRPTRPTWKKCASSIAVWVSPTRITLSGPWLNGAILKRGLNWIWLICYPKSQSTSTACSGIPSQPMPICRSAKGFFRWLKPLNVFRGNSRR